MITLSEFEALIRRRFALPDDLTEDEEKTWGMLPDEEESYREVKAFGALDIDMPSPDVPKSVGSASSGFWASLENGGFRASRFQSILEVEEEPEASDSEDSSHSSSAESFAVPATSPDSSYAYESFSQFSYAAPSTARYSTASSSSSTTIRARPSTMHSATPTVRPLPARPSTAYSDAATLRGSAAPSVLSKHASRTESMHSDCSEATLRPATPPQKECGDWECPEFPDSPGSNGHRSSFYASSADSAHSPPDTPLGSPRTPTLLTPELGPRVTISPLDTEPPVRGGLPDLPQAASQSKAAPRTSMPPASRPLGLPPLKPAPTKALPPTPAPRVSAPRLQERDASYASTRAAPPPPTALLKKPSFLRVPSIRRQRPRVVIPARSAAEEPERRPAYMQQQRASLDAFYLCPSPAPTLLHYRAPPPELAVWPSWPPAGMPEALGARSPLRRSLPSPRSPGTPTAHKRSVSNPERGRGEARPPAYFRPVPVVRTPPAAHREVSVCEAERRRTDGAALAPPRPRRRAAPPAVRAPGKAELDDLLEELLNTPRADCAGAGWCPRGTLQETLAGTARLQALLRGGPARPVTVHRASTRFSLPVWRKVSPDCSWAELEREWDARERVHGGGAVRRRPGQRPRGPRPLGHDAGWAP